MSRLFGPFLGGPAAVGLLVLRLVGGVALMFHGWSKIQNPFGWMGPGAPVPGFFQALAALAEFGGGLAWILGLLTPIASFGLVVNMLVAALMFHVAHGDPFVSSTGGRSYEPALGYFADALLLLLAGPGTLSLDARLFRKRSSD